MKKSTKQEIRSWSHEQMMKELNNLNLERMKAESYLRLGAHQNNRVAMSDAKKHIANTDKSLPTTLRNIKKRMAFIKQEMHMRLLKNEKN